MTTKNDFISKWYVLDLQFSASIGFLMLMRSPVQSNQMLRRIQQVEFFNEEVILFVCCEFRACANFAWSQSRCGLRAPQSFKDSPRAVDLRRVIERVRLRRVRGNSGTLRNLSDPPSDR